MPIGIDGIHRSIKNIAELSFKRLSDGRLFNLAKPSSFLLNRGFGQKRVQTVNAQGNQAFADTYVISEDPQLQVVMNQWQPEILQLKIGEEFQSQTTTLDATKSFDVTALSTITPIPINIGQTITINSFEATRTLANESVDAAALVTVDTVARTVQFDPSLEGDRVTFRFNVEVTGVRNIVVTPPTYSVAATLITTDLEIVLLEIPSVSTNFDTAQINPNAEGVDLNFFVNTPAGACTPYTWHYTNQYLQC